MAIDLSGQDPLFQGLASGLRQLSQSELQNLQSKRQAELADWREQQQLGRKASGIQAIAPNELSDEQARGLAGLPDRALQEYIRQAQETQAFQGAQEARQRAAQNMGLGALQEQQPQQQQQMPQDQQLDQQQPTDQFQQPPQQPNQLQQPDQQVANVNDQQFQNLKQAAEQRNLSKKDIEEYKQGMTPEQYQELNETFKRSNPFYKLDNEIPTIPNNLGGKPMESYRSLQKYLEENEPEYRRLKRDLEQASLAVDESPNPAAMRRNQEREDKARKRLSEYYNQKQEDFKQSKEDVRSLLKPNSPFSKLVERTENDENVLNRTLYHLNQARSTPPEDRPNFWGYLVSGFKRGGLADTLIRKGSQIMKLAGTDDNTLIGNIGPGIVGKVMGDSIGDITNSIATVMNRLTPEGAQLQDNLNALKNDLNRSMDYAKDTMGEHKFNKFLGQTITMFSSQQALENFYNIAEGVTRIGYADKFALDKVLEENNGMPVKDYKTRMKPYKEAYLKEVTDELARVADESYQRVIEAQDSAPIGELMKGGKWWQAAQEAAARPFRWGEETQAPGLLGLDPDALQGI